MPESRIDPRHSAAFQRGYSGGDAEDRSPVGSATSAPFQRGYQPPAPSARPEPRVDAPPSRWTLHDEAAATAAEVDEVFSDLAPERAASETVSGAADDPERELADRRRFRIWTIALFTVGFGLVVLSYVLFGDGWSSMYMSYSTDSEGVMTIQTPDGPREVTQFEVQFAQYKTTVAPWIGIVGFATIVGNLFRLAGRR